MVDDNRENGTPEDRVTVSDDSASAESSSESAAADAAGDETESDGEFADRVENARELIGEDATAFYVGVVREGREVDSTFAQQADDAQEEGMQALSLLASHLRLVSDEAGVDYTTVAADAVTLAEQLGEQLEEE